MKRRIATILVVLGLVAAVMPRDLVAWSRDGHRIVCRIAWQLLDQGRRSEIERLTSAYRDPDGQPLASYWDACAYADDVRAKAGSTPGWTRFAVFETWHYANVPRTTTRLPTPPCQTPCVISAVLAHADSLSRSAGEQSRTEALFFLSHWVGDLHQPLHLGFADDRGGNDVRPIDGGYYNVSNMHALWDAGILGKQFTQPNWQEFADQLASDISPAQRATWSEGTAADWAQESYNIVTSARAKYCEWQFVGGSASCDARPGGRELGAAYQAEFGDDVMQRLQQAGVRLAHLLQQHLAVQR